MEGLLDKTIILFFCSILTIRAVRTVLLRFLDNVVRMDEYLLHSSSKVRQIHVRFENMQLPAIKVGPKIAVLKGQCCEMYFFYGLNILISTFCVYADYF